MLKLVCSRLDGGCSSGVERLTVAQKVAGPKPVTHPIHVVRIPGHMAIRLSPDTTKQLVASIKQYFAEHLEQEIGDLKAGMLLDYCLKEIGSV